MCVHVHINVDAREVTFCAVPREPTIFSFSFFFWDRTSDWVLRSVNISCCSGSPRDLPVFTSPVLGFQVNFTKPSSYPGAGDQILVFMHSWQALPSLSHLPSPTQSFLFLIREIKFQSSLVGLPFHIHQSTILWAQFLGLWQVFQETRSSSVALFFHRLLILRNHSLSPTSLPGTVAHLQPPAIAEAHEGRSLEPWSFRSA